MFRQWGRFVYGRRRLVATLAILAALASLALAARTSGVLSTGGWYSTGSESHQVADRLARDFGDGQSSLVVLFVAPGRSDAASPAFQSELHAALARLRADPRVRSIAGYAETGSSRFVSTGGDASWVLVNLNLADGEASAAVSSLRAEIATPQGMTVQLTGDAALGAAMTAQSERDLARAETVSLPIALLILLLVFGSLVAAGLPLLVAGLAIPSALAVVWLFAQFTTMSVFVSSVVTMLGLALAIDYSLFIVSRFREELGRGASVEDAVASTMATSGKAVAFSGTAVAVGLSGLLFLRAPTLNSMGIGGAIIALCSVVYALTFLPALLGMLGPRVERLRVRLPRVATPASGNGGWWARMAGAVMRRPVAVLVPILAVLVVLGSPFLGQRQGLPDATLLSPGDEARQAYETIQREFPAGETTPIDLLVTVRGNPLSAANAEALAGYVARVRDLPGVARVDGPFALTDPTTGRPLPPAAVAGLVAAAPAARPAAIGALLATDVRGSTVHLAAVSPLRGDAARQDLVKRLRALAPGSGLTVQVGGADATSLDFLAGQDERLPIAVGFILAAMAAMLFLQFGSVVLPLKAVVMTLLSLSASFGALVWIFQDGNLSGVLGFTSPGFTIAIVPILMFSVVFGLSMDYEVLLLSRIQEAYRRGGDNAAAVASGLARTGRVITGAALIMVSVFLAFGLADSLIIKSLGIGLALAVLLDATVVRAFLVPATMRLLGDLNWWAPAWLARVAARSGFGEAPEGEVVEDAFGEGEAVAA